MKIEPTISEGIEIKVLCTDLDINGDGICRWNNIVVRVQGLIPEEIAIVKVTYKARNYWIADLVKVLTYSHKRSIPKCQIFKECGGCSIQHIDTKYHSQLKVSSVMDKLLRIGNLQLIPELEIHPPAQFYKYRNKTSIPATITSKNTIQFGYYKRKSHSIVPFDSCPILTESIDYSIKNSIKAIIDDNNLCSSLRHICIRSSNYTNKILLILITSYTIEDKSFVSTIINNEPNLFDGIVNNLQPQNTNSIFGKESMILFGRSFIIEKFLGLKFKIGITSFFQVNLIEAEKAVNEIIQDVLHSKNVVSILDTYSGIGTITLPLAVTGISTIGIEINHESHLLALDNAKINGIENVTFISGSVYHHLCDFLSKDQYLIVDPPRKGLDESIINLIKTRKPNNIAYLSCNPSTLSRDLKQILDNTNYTIKSIHTFDFFPNTMHIECLAFLKSY